MDLLKLTTKIAQENYKKTSMLARECGVKAQTIRHWEVNGVDDALLSNVNAVLNACGYELAIVRKCEVDND